MARQEPRPPKLDKTFVFRVAMICVLLSASVFAADLSLPISGGDSNLNSLIQLLEKKAMLEAQDTAKKRTGHLSIEPGRPKPELGKRNTKPTTPIDLSRYLGTEGDQEEAIRRLKQAGKWPSGAETPTGRPKRDLFQKIPTEKRLDFASECLKLGKYADALSETTFVLATDPKDKNLARALALRVRAQYRLGKFKEAEDTYYRLRAYFPKGPEAATALQFIEHESGLDRLQDAVRRNQNDPMAQQKLIEAYRTRNWLDLAVEFYTQRLPKKTAESYRHLCELHYLRKDWRGLVNASEKGIQLLSDSPEFYYNRGVGYYHMQNGATKLSARESFTKAEQLSKNKEFNQRADWYLKRLPGRE